MYFLENVLFKKFPLIVDNCKHSSNLLISVLQILGFTQRSSPPTRPLCCSSRTWGRRTRATTSVRAFTPTTSRCLPPFRSAHSVNLIWRKILTNYYSFNFIFSWNHLGRRSSRTEWNHSPGLQNQMRRSGLASGHHRLAQGEPYRFHRYMLKFSPTLKMGQFWAATHCLISIAKNPRKGFRDEGNTNQCCPSTHFCNH